MKVATRFLSAVAAISLCLPASATYVFSILDNGNAHGSAAYGAGGGQQVGVALSAPFPATTPSHALMWTGTAGTQIDLNPAGYSDSIATGAGGGKQIGYGYRPGSGAEALLWSGSADSFVSLQPSGWSSTFGNDTDGVQQVGEGYLGGSLRAMLWSGSADTLVDLTPDGKLAAAAKGVDNGIQVGYAGETGPYPQHAYKWTGTAESGVDLNPDGAEFSQANAISGTQIVGYFGDSSDLAPHACLWDANTNAFVDLHTTMDWSYAWATNGQFQAGYGYLNNVEHALAWSGTQDSMVDLNTFLPTGWTEAGATAIDDDGSIYGFAKFGNQTYAVKWGYQPVPEPATYLALTLGILPLLRKRRR